MHKRKYTTEQPDPTMIQIWGKDNCFKCDRTAKMFETANIPFQYFDLLAQENETMLNELKEKNILSAPYVKTPQGTEWSDFRAEHIRQTIEQNKN